MVTLDEAGMAGAALQRFQPQCASAGKGIDHMRVLDDLAKAAAGKNIEQRFAHTVRRGTGVSARRFGQFCAAMTAGDDSHAVLPPKKICPKKICPKKTGQRKTCQRKACLRRTCLRRTWYRHLACCPPI